MTDLIFATACLAIPTLSVLGALLVAESIRKEVKNNMSQLTQQLADLQAAIAAAKEQIQKAKAEVVGKIDTLNQRITDLETQLANGAITPEVQAALDAVKASVTDLQTASQAIDDVVPDAPPAA